jgi:hypothetical protein
MAVPGALLLLALLLLLLLLLLVLLAMWRLAWAIARNRMRRELASAAARFELQSQSQSQDTLVESFTLGWLNLVVRALWTPVLEKHLAGLVMELLQRVLNEVGMDCLHASFRMCSTCALLFVWSGQMAFEPS